MKTRGLKLRLMVMNFIQFFIWGSWLISLGGYMMSNIHQHPLTGDQVGLIYGTMGIASLFMPGILGYIADRWINAERLVAGCHCLSGLLLILAANLSIDSQAFAPFYITMLGVSLLYMPTIALTNSIAYSSMGAQKIDIVKEFPRIRVWGTIGFITAMWCVDLTGAAISNIQLYLAGGISIIMAIYSTLLLPACPPTADKSTTKTNLLSILGFDAFRLVKDYKMAVFFIFSMLLGACLQITNAFGNPFLHSFAQTHPDSFVVLHPNVLLSFSQISEALFILAIPYIMGKYGIKRVMVLSIFAWVFRFGFFAIGGPEMPGFIFLALSMLVYGMAFDFFNISGSIFVEKEAPHSMRSSAQGLFMIMTNGIGATIGASAAGWVVKFFTQGEGQEAIIHWPSIWAIFAAYALILGIVFQFAFRYKENSSNK